MCISCRVHTVQSVSVLFQSALIKSKHVRSNASAPEGHSQCDTVKCFVHYRQLHIQTTRWHYSQSYIYYRNGSSNADLSATNNMLRSSTSCGRFVNLFLHFYLLLLSSVREEEEVCMEVIFTVVDQQGEFMESQRAVGRHTEEREELTGAWKTRRDTWGTGVWSLWYIMTRLHKSVFNSTMWWLSRLNNTNVKPGRRWDKHLHSKCSVRCMKLKICLWTWSMNTND